MISVVFSAMIREKLDKKELCLLSSELLVTLDLIQNKQEEYNEVNEVCLTLGMFSYHYVQAWKMACQILLYY